MKYTLSRKYVTRARTSTGCWHFYKGFDRAFAEQVVAEHDKLTKNSPENLLKFDRKRTTSHVRLEGKDVVVKEFTRKPFRWIFSFDRRNWFNALVMREKGYHVPRPYAWFKSAGQGYILMEYCGSRSLFDILHSQESRELKLELVSKALSFAARLHTDGIYHRDMKTKNWIVNDQKNIFLIDLEDISFSRPIRKRETEKILAQLLSLPEDLHAYKQELTHQYRLARTT